MPIDALARTPRPTLGRVALRYLSGRWLDGRRRTDATFFRPGHKPLVRWHVGRWSYLPGWQRALARVAVPPLVVLVTWTALFGSPLASVLRIVFWWGFPVWMGCAVELVRRRQHRHRYHIPTARWYAERFAVPVHVARQAIQVPRGHVDDPDLESVIRLPDGYDKSEAQQRLLATAVGKKLGLVDPDWTLDALGTPTLFLRAAPPPPSLVTYEQVTGYLERATDTSLFCGLGRRGMPVYLNWVDAAPWCGMSLPAGMGKSTLCKLLAVQVIRSGGRVVIFDFPKGGDSHPWCRQEDGSLLSGVELYRTVDKAHEALIDWDAERLRRANASYDRVGEVPQRTFVIIEEANVSIDQLRDYWTTIRERSDPLRCPSVGALKSLACTARSALINGAVIAQKLSAAAAGGEVVRENLGILFIAGASRRTLANLIPDVTPAPRMGRHKGRLIMAAGKDVTEFQVAQLTDEEARGWALGGVPQPGVGSVVGGGKTLGESVGRTTPPSDPREGLVTISQACQEGIVGAPLSAVTKFRERYPDRFPTARYVEGPGLPHWYDPTELIMWDATRSVDTPSGRDGVSTDSDDEEPS